MFPKFTVSWSVPEDVQLTELIDIDTHPVGIADMIKFGGNVIKAR